MFEVFYLHQTFIDCVSNQSTHTSMCTCQMWLQVMKCPFILSRFLGISHIIEDYSCLEYCIFIKLSQIVFYVLKKTFWHIVMTDVTSVYGKLTYLIVFLGNFYICNIAKFSQIVYQANLQLLYACYKSVYLKSQHL